MYRDNYINSLRIELLEMVADHLTPVAMKYGYSEVPLETTIKWRPQVLVLGNYSSGKSTLINEFLGAKIQGTGQAPTDDSFTVITFDDSLPPDSPVQTIEERDGKVLLNDPEYPYEILKKHGQRFAAHFRLKKVNSPFLKNLAIIDTPGMLDSITERDRGYNYQEVIGDLAQIADLVLVLFDPHKAGTVREAHTSLRETLPAKTFEDRVLFVLNRIDECASMMDLIRVYGTLCWNLSQITGRKDIPMIHLTYSPGALQSSSQQPPEYLKYLENQREVLKKAVLKAPCHRLDNLASFVETHGQRLAHLLEALINFRLNARRFHMKGFGAALIAGLLAAGVSWMASMAAPAVASMDTLLQLAVYGTIGAGCTALWMTTVHRWFYRRFHKKILDTLNELTPLANQTRRDCWEHVSELVKNHLEKTGGKYSLAEVKHQHEVVCQIYEKGSRDIREALKEIAGLPPDQEDGGPEQDPAFTTAV